MTNQSDIRALLGLHDDFDREDAWRKLSYDLYLRLAECQPLKLGRVTALPKLPAQDELDAFVSRFRALSEAGGWTSRQRKRRWWWPFS